MQTTCPECRTTFRVNQEHLGARRGLVRCGRCNAVFNAYNTLLPELEEPPGGDPVASDAQSIEPELSDGVSPVGDSPAENAPCDQRQADSDVATAPQRIDAAAIDAEPDARQAAPPDILLQPLWQQTPKPRRSWRTLLIGFLAVLLLGLLFLQAAYFLRAELAAAAPITRPALEWFCRPLNCVVPLPRQLTQDAIAASSLEHDPEQKSRVRLTFLLTNRTGQRQAWPNITLTLSDVREAPVAQKVFRPSLYLPKDVKITAGMAAGAEREVRLDLDIGNLVASGYALSLTYP